MRVDVALIALAPVFSLAWKKMVMQRSLVVYHGISHLSLVCSWYTHLHESKSRGIFHGIPLESVT